MSLLQAARANVLCLPLESAYSWGLNRATFIAAARRGFKGGSGSGSAEASSGPKPKNSYFLGDDMAYRTTKDGILLFTFGGKVQTRDEFDKRVRARFGKNFPAAWKEALAYVRGFDNSVLLSAGDFFNIVYKPVRDEWADRWTEAAEQ